MFQKLKDRYLRLSLAAWGFATRKWVAKNSKGQALSEYAVIIGVVVGVLVVAVVVAFRQQIIAAFQSATNALAGAR